MLPTATKCDPQRSRSASQKSSSVGIHRWTPPGGRPPSREGGVCVCVCFVCVCVCVCACTHMCSA